MSTIHERVLSGEIEEPPPCPYCGLAHRGRPARPHAALAALGVSQAQVEALRLPPKDYTIMLPEDQWHSIAGMADRYKRIARVDILFGEEVMIVRSGGAGAAGIRLPFSAVQKAHALSEGSPLPVEAFRAVSIDPYGRVVNFEACTSARTTRYSMYAADLVDLHQVPDMFEGKANAATIAYTARQTTPSECGADEATAKALSGLSIIGWQSRWRARDASYLPAEEIAEVRASWNARRLIIGFVSGGPEPEIPLLDGSGTWFVVHQDWIREAIVNRDGFDNATTMRIADCGQTLVFGEVEVCAEWLIDEYHRRRAQVKQDPNAKFSERLKSAGRLIERDIVCPTCRRYFCTIQTVSEADVLVNCPGCIAEGRAP